MVLLFSYHHIVCDRCMNMYQTEPIQFTGRRFTRVCMRIWTKTSSFSRISNWEFLDLEIDSEGRLRIKLYDKRDYFNFPIVNFPFICSNIPAAPSYGVYIVQLIRYSRACGSYQDFLDRGLLLTTKLLSQGLLLIKLKSSLRKFYGATMIWLTIMEYTCPNDHGYVPLIVSTSRSFPHSWLITGFLTKLTSGGGTAYISGALEFTTGLVLLDL